METGGRSRRTNRIRRKRSRAKSRRNKFQEKDHMKNKLPKHRQELCYRNRPVATYAPRIGDRIWKLT